MNDLEQARSTIERVDREMAALFVERMHCAEIIADYKKKHGLPILDISREKALIERNSGYIEESELKPYYVQYMQAVMDVSKRYQHMLAEGLRVAYSGIEGSFASIAAGRLFNDGTLVPYMSFKDAYNAVMSDECDLCVLPIENSYAGEVGQVMDIMFEGRLFINGVYSLDISQNLLGIPGTQIEDIKKVISHPQALDQCAKYIGNHGWDTEQSSNTARAAKLVSELNDNKIAAIASKETADLYGLEIIDHDINEDRSNTTRFAVFSKSFEKVIMAEDYSTFILMFTVKNSAGSLADAIGVIGKYGYSMRVLRSRPLKTIQWQYYFYAEVEGKLSSDKVNVMLDEFADHCEELKVVGSFTKNKKI